MDTSDTQTPVASPAEPKPVSRQALWQREQRAKGNCPSCGSPKGDSTSKSLCTPCLTKFRQKARVKTGVPLDKPVRKWPKEWREHGNAEYVRRVKRASKGLDPMAPRTRNSWPKEWTQLPKKEYTRLTIRARKGLDVTVPPRVQLQHPPEWRELPISEYTRRAKQARREYEASLKNQPATA